MRNLTSTFLAWVSSIVCVVEFQQKGLALHFQLELKPQGELPPSSEAVLVCDAYDVMRLALGQLLQCRI